MRTLADLKGSIVLPEGVWAALAVLTTEELENLRAFWREDGAFWGIGFVGPGGKVCRYGDKRRRDACDIIESQYRREIRKYHG